MKFKDRIEILLEHCGLGHNCNNCKFYQSNSEYCNKFKELKLTLNELSNKELEEVAKFPHKQIESENPLDDMDDGFIYSFAFMKLSLYPNQKEKALIEFWVENPKFCNKCPLFENKDEI